MLVAETNKMINKIEELMNFTAGKMTLKNMASMDSDDFTMFKKCMELMEISCEICLEQARVIEKLENTTDELLEINRKLLILV